MTSTRFDTTVATAPKPKLHQVLLSWLPYLMLPLIVYFANVELQSYWGREALASVQLEKHGLEEALAIAKRENKLVLVDMSAIWCSNCRKLDKEVLSKRNVQERIQQNYIFARIEYESDAGKAFMQRYDVSGLPSLLVISATGEKLRKLPLSFSPEKFIQNL